MAQALTVVAAEANAAQVLTVVAVEASVVPIITVVEVVVVPRGEGSVEPVITVVAAGASVDPVIIVVVAVGCVDQGITVAGNNPRGRLRMALKLVDDLFYSKRSDKHLFLNPNLPDWMVVNSNAALLLSQCDGQTSPRDIAALYDVPIPDIEALFQQAKDRGLLHDLSESALDECRQVASPEHLSTTGRLPHLGVVHWKLTNACNLKCSYCYAESGQTHTQMTLDELTHVAHQVAEVSPSVEHILSGGEPLLHPDCLTFAEQLKSSGSQITLLTNGILVNKKNIHRITSLFNHAKISLDGSEEDIHALTRGSTHYAHIVQVIDDMIELGLRVTVAMTVHRGNLHDIGPMSQRYGSRLTFQPLFMAGRGADENALAITGEEYYQALAGVESVAPMAAIGTVLENLRGKGSKRCALADTEISISETGDVYPCQLLVEPEFVAGNVHSTTLKDIYFDSDVLKKIREISIDTIDKCSTCPIRLLCAGGCRARDYFEVGSLEEAGAFCEYEQHAFIHGLFDSTIL